MILGVLLAGGASRRFGADKAEARLNRRPLIEHAIAALAPHVDVLVVSGRHWPGFETIDDRPRSGLGPLGGLNAALHHAQAHGYASVLSAPCDMPVLPADLLALLSPAPACLAAAPVVGHWPAGLASKLSAFLESGPDRSLIAWARFTGARLVGGGEALANINTVQDLAAIHRQGAGAST